MHNNLCLLMKTFRRPKVSLILIQADPIVGAKIGSSHSLANVAQMEQQNTNTWVPVFKFHITKGQITSEATWTTVFNRERIG